MKLVVTIDTEEDNWGAFSGPPSTRNAREIPRLQDLFDRYGVRPTYLLTYSMASDDRLVGYLNEARDQNRCEIGAHCHPWNTPPFLEMPKQEHSMLSNLPMALVKAKLTRLHEHLRERLEYSPTSFRSGRWGYGPYVASTLSRLGYLIDTSVTAFTDWRAIHGPNYSAIVPDLYRFSPRDIFEPDDTGSMVQLPASVGYLKGDFRRWNRVENMIRSSPVKHLGLLGILDRLSILQKVAFSPEIATGQQMCRLVETFFQKKYRYINLFFHSSTLLPGLTPFVRTKSDRDAFLSRIEYLLAHLEERGITSVTATEVAQAELGLRRNVAPSHSKTFLPELS